MCYADKNRVNCRHAGGQDQPTLRAQDIPLQRFLPSEQDYEMLKERMQIVLGRIICRYMPYFMEHFSDLVTHNFEHEHSAEMSLQSEIVSWDLWTFCWLG